MKYTLIWKPAVEDRLAQLWIEATDRQAIASAADEIDRYLRTHPSSVGEARDALTRILIADPLAIIYEVNELDCMVYILGVWKIPLQFYE